MKICFCLHDHQPAGNFEHVMESAFSNCYAPMLEVIRAHGGISAGLHVSGTLLEWLEARHPEHVEEISALCRAGRLELLTGGRYEPVLTVFRRNDIMEQIRDFSSHLEGISGTLPRGLWLTERVWEPRLASVIAASGVEWAVVDDIHLRRAGALEEDLHRPCVTEDSGRTLRLLAGDMRMRYMIPFSPVEDVMGKLREYRDSGVKLVFYGDDGEKFGVWPGTHELCYGSGWLNDFFEAVASSDWLEVVLPSEAAALPAAGPFYVPACSYAEMGRWTLLGSDRDDYGRALELLRGSELEGEAERLLAGGFWRNFLTFYPEAKELHGRILSSEQMVRSSGDREALHHFWRSQCNCAFWHGVFGGIYLPHLREAVWKEINMAERRALESAGGHLLASSLDLNADGLSETVISTPVQSLIVHPGRGLTVSQLTFMDPGGAPVPVGNVLSRRTESYHADIPPTSAADGVRTIHSEMGSKEAGLAEKLVTDRWRRVCFTQLVLRPPACFRDWERCSGSIFPVELSSESFGPEEGEGALEFRCRSVLDGLSFHRRLSVHLSKAMMTIRTETAGGAGQRVGTEVCLNLMTGSSPDRFFRIDGGGERMMSEGGEFRGSSIEVVDMWRGVRVIIGTGSGSDIWAAPLDSVNRSESGFERVHQGTAFLISRICGDGPEVMDISLWMEPLDGGPDDPR